MLDNIVCIFHLHWNLQGFALSNAALSAIIGQRVILPLIQTRRGIHAVSDQLHVQELLLLMISTFVFEYGPVLIILEDIQLFDSVSLRLMADVLKALPSSCLLISSRRPNAGIFDPTFSSQVFSNCS